MAEIEHLKYQRGVQGFFLPGRILFQIGPEPLTHLIPSSPGPTSTTTQGHLSSRIAPQFHITHISLHGSGAPLSVYGLDAERIVVAQWITRILMTAVPTSVVDTRVDMKLSRFSVRYEDWRV